MQKMMLRELSTIPDVLIVAPSGGTFAPIATSLSAILGNRMFPVPSVEQVDK